jgi:hypothetical protein
MRAGGVRMRKQRERELSVIDTAPLKVGDFRDTGKAESAANERE